MSTYSLPTINQRPPQPVDLGFWADIRFDADDSQPTYIGLHLTNGASVDLTDWKLYKFTYSGSNATRIQLAYGTWTDRATYF
jgi:hypothetical protein